MAEEQIIEVKFNHADLNHDGTIDEQEFRQFLGPVRDERRLSRNITQQDIRQIQAQSSHPSQTVIYPVGLDIAVAGFTENPISYEKYTRSFGSREDHSYGVGPDVGIGAPNVAAKQSRQYDPAGAMFDYADVNRDGRIDKQEFGAFMRSV